MSVNDSVPVTGTRRGVLCSADGGARRCLPLPRVTRLPMRRSLPLPSPGFLRRCATGVVSGSRRVVVHPSFNALRVFNAPIQRLWTGALWSEGPAWSSQGRYLVWSDIPNDRQLRWIEDEGRVSVMRQPSNNSNGNTFDFQGRQLSCEHLRRRVVRYEHDGSVTVIADSLDGKALNSPNDVVPHPDGSYWFTDPPFGGAALRGRGRCGRRAGQPRRACCGRASASPRISAPRKQQLPSHVYRVDPKGKLAIAVDGATLPGVPNGLAFSPDYTRLYIVCAWRPVRRRRGRRAASPA